VARVPSASAVGGTVFNAYAVSGDLFDEMFGQRVSSTGTPIAEPYRFCTTCG
jgi:hypothetical protein